MKYRMFSALLALLSASSAIAKEPFSADRFAELQASGAVTLIDVYAPWCPTCRMQQEALARYAQAHPDRRLEVLVIDFDHDKAAVTRFQAPRQSTLILYRGTERAWFSVAETRYETIEQALENAFGHRS